MTGAAPHSGEDPMAGDPLRADAARAMQTVIRSHTHPAGAVGGHEHPADIVGGHRQERTARGRFGRDVPGPAPDDVQDARTTMQTDDTLERVAALGYRVDPDAVAGAIIDRLLAGRTLPTRRDGP
jgi:hypothetical protein